MVRPPVTATLMFILIGLLAGPVGAREASEPSDMAFASPVRVLDFFGTVQKVIDLPDLRSLEVSDDVYMDLGYRHKDFGGGEWVGYVGTTTRYVPLTFEQLTRMLKLDGRTRPPPPPEPPKADLYFIAVAVGLLVFFFVGKQALVSANKKSPRRGKPMPTGAEKRLAALTANQKRAKVAKPASTPKPKQSKRDYMAPPASGGFGRRTW